jgi:hypothetical protein
MRRAQQHGSIVGPACSGGEDSNLRSHAGDFALSNRRIRSRYPMPPNERVR